MIQLNREGEPLVSQYDKLIEKIKNNPKSVNFEDLRKILLKEGFQERQSRKGSSHYIYTKESDMLTIPKDHPLNEIYVKQALQILGL